MLVPQPGQPRKNVQQDAHRDAERAPVLEDRGPVIRRNADYLEARAPGDRPPLSLVCTQLLWLVSPDPPVRNHRDEQSAAAKDPCRFDEARLDVRKVFHRSEGEHPVESPAPEGERHAVSLYPSSLRRMMTRALKRRSGEVQADAVCGGGAYQREARCPTNAAPEIQKQLAAKVAEMFHRAPEPLEIRMLYVLGEVILGVVVLPQGGRSRLWHRSLGDGVRVRQIY